MTEQLAGLQTYDERRKLEPKEIIRYAVEKYNIRQFTGLFSGGKDSLVTCLLSYEAIQDINKEQGLNIGFNVLHCYTGIGSHENFEYVLKTANKYGWHLTVEYPNQDEEYPQNELLKVLWVWGFAGRKWHKVWLKALKYNSIRRYYKAHPETWFISGKSPTNSERRKQQVERALKQGRTVEDLYAGYDDNLPSIKPMFFVTKAETWQIVRERNLQLVSSYERQSHSLECLCPGFATLTEHKELRGWKDTRPLAIDLDILNEQYGGWHYVTDKRGRKYLKNFGTWGNPPKTKALKDNQEQLTEAMEDLACVECSALRLEVDGEVN